MSDRGPPDYFDDRGQTSAPPRKTVIATLGEICVPAYIDGDFSPTPDLHAAIATAMTKFESVAKRGKNDFQKYKYPTHDDMKEMAAPILGECGLSYEQHEVSVQEFSDNLVSVIYLFRVCHSSGQKGPFERVTALALKSNKGGADEKSISKIRTQAWKDWFKGRFCIAAGDPPAEDPDYGYRPDDNEERPPRQQRQSNNQRQERQDRSPATARLEQATGAQPQTQQPQDSPEHQEQQKRGELEKSAKARADAIIASLGDTRTSEQVDMVLKGEVVAITRMKKVCPVQYADLVKRAASINGLLDRVGNLQNDMPTFHQDMIDAAMKPANDGQSQKAA